jgi:hypothetical protein
MEKLIKSQNGQWTLTKAAPKLDSGHSVFTMDHVNEVSKMKDHGKAKEYAHGIVDSSSAQPHNKSSIKNMIDKSKSAQNLAFGMSNHVLAHPSEGLKVVKGETPDMPTPSNPTKGGEGTNEMAKDEDGSEMLFSQLESIAHHVKEIRESMKPSEESPDWVNAKITEAAKQLSDVAHYIQGEKAVNKADVPRTSAHDRDTAQRYRDMPAGAKGTASKQPSIGQKEVDQAVRTVEANLPKILKPKK